ncbi:hypothetical protein KDK95_24695 [Actinospica sp. MGRD01-02]|uniref:Uncharacterized protein n=2 Tax=Actinospica acidithermotolerans TaxID=2828514 RepID=A0A941IL17_9ACTN|nr:hypothetical protein [Actinospica acidithermotolerans]
MWRSFAHTVRPDGAWVWGGREDSNSISDAEQLLVLLYPATELEGFSIDRPDSTEDDVLSALAGLGDRIQLPRMVIDILWDYLSRHTDKNGEPVFNGGDYVSSLDPNEAPSEEQRRLDLVESYSMSVTLCLAAAGFSKSFSASVTRPALRARLAEVDEAINRRLTAAMVGLLRSFTLNVLDAGSQAESNLLTMLGQGRSVGRDSLSMLHRDLEPVRSLLPDLSIGVAQEADLFDNPDRLFECGWTWGVAADAPPVELSAEHAFIQPPGYAASRPSLYFTVSALDGLGDLFSPRTRRLSLLSGDQQRLASALQLRWDLAQQYWSTIARFGGDRWPLEDVPWLTTFEDESEYYTLLVFSILLQDRVSRRITDDDLTRAVAVLEELAMRGRITRRITRGDSAIGLHTPGVPIELAGSEAIGPPAVWYAADFAVMLAKRAVQAAGLSGQPEARNRLLTIAERSMDHLARRRLKTGPSEGLWDDAAAILPDGTGGGGDRLPSWHMNERMMEFMVASANMYTRVPLRTNRISDTARSLLIEVDHVLGRELLMASGEGDSQLMIMLRQMQGRLASAQQVFPELPGTALALAAEMLRELAELSSARQGALRRL